MSSKNFSILDEEFMNDSAEAWEEANSVDDNFIKSVTGEEPDYTGEIQVEQIGTIEFGDPSLPFGNTFKHNSGIFSSILNKFIDPSTGLPIEE